MMAANSSWLRPLQILYSFQFYGEHQVTFEFGFWCIVIGIFLLAFGFTTLLSRRAVVWSNMIFLCVYGDLLLLSSRILWVFCFLRKWDNNWKHYLWPFYDRSTKYIYFAAGSVQVPVCCLLSAFISEWVYTPTLPCTWDLEESSHFSAETVNVCPYYRLYVLWGHSLLCLSLCIWALHWIRHMRAMMPSGGRKPLRCQK